LGPSNRCATDHRELVPVNHSDPTASRSSKFLPFASVLALAWLTEPIAEAKKDPKAEGAVAVEASSEGSAADGEGAVVANDGEGEGEEQRWIDKHAPEPMMLELGVWGGVLFPSPQLELFEADQDLPDQGRKQYGLLAPDVGVRLGFYPLRHFGIEAEGGAMPASLRDSGGKPVIWAGRGHLVGQIGLWRLTPFIVAGAGAMGVASPRSVVGSEADIAVHFGAGLKFFVNHWIMLRLDVRDNLTNRVGVGEGVTHSPEILLGLSVTLGRKKSKPVAEPTPGPSDRDGDGLLDADDTCPDDPETVNGYLDEDGCPESDRDGDGFWDDQDTCPDEAETATASKTKTAAPTSCPTRSRRSPARSRASRSRTTATRSARRRPRRSTTRSRS